MTLTSDSSIRNAYALALLRIGVGILFLIFGQYKVFSTTFTLHGGFQFWINKFLEGGAYHGAHSARFCSPARDKHRLSGGLWRIGDRSRAGFRHHDTLRKLLRTHLYADHALLFGLSRCSGGLLAILRSKLEPLRICALLRRVSDRARRLCLVDEGVAASSRGREWG